MLQNIPLQINAALLNIKLINETWKKVLWFPQKKWYKTVNNNNVS